MLKGIFVLQKKKETKIVLVTVQWNPVNRTTFGPQSYELTELITLVYVVRWTDVTE